MNILAAIDDPNLLGYTILDPASMKPWRAALGAAYGLPLDDEASELFRQCTGLADAPTSPASYLWLVVGRRGGKSRAMAIAATYAACFVDWQPYLVRGEKAVVLLVAQDRQQAKILHSYICGALEAPLLRSMVQAVTADTIELRGNVLIEVATRSYRAVRGRSVCTALLDELAFWRNDASDSANPDSEILSAIGPAMATFGDAGKVIAGSSPYAKTGVLWQAYKNHYGQPNGTNLVWKADTRTMNPTVPAAYIAKQIENDPINAAAEFGAEFRSDLEEFVSLEILESCVVNGVFEIEPSSKHRYVAFVDPSGGSSDSMTLAICHAEKGENKGNIVLDCIREVRAPFAPEGVVHDFCDTLKSYRLTRVVGDRYAGEWPREQFRKRGVTYDLSEDPKSDIYQGLIPLLNSGWVQLLDNRRLINQFHSLERRVARGGRDSIDHPRGMHDDIANAVAGALVLASAKGTGMHISDACLARLSQPLPRYDGGSLDPNAARSAFAPLASRGLARTALIGGYHSFDSSSSGIPSRACNPSLASLETGNSFSDSASSSLLRKFAVWRIMKTAG